MNALPSEPDFPLLHTRRYDVQAYRKADDLLLLRGTVEDRKPAGLYIADDPEPLTVHHMIVDIEVDMKTSVITSASVVYEEFPHRSCPGIVAHYQKLVGLSVSRGFTHKVRELFGGPNGCTHVTALLQAMAPIVHQSRFSMVMADPEKPRKFGDEASFSPEHRTAMLRGNLNTCHIWDENGDHAREVMAGGMPELPMWIDKRLAKLGKTLDDLRAG